MRLIHQSNRVVVERTFDYCSIWKQLTNYFKFVSFYYTLVSAWQGIRKPKSSLQKLEQFFSGKIFECPYMENGKVIDRLYLISKE